MFAIRVPGQSGALWMRFPTADAALEKYRALEADGLTRIELQDAKGEDLTVAELEQRVANAAAHPQAVQQ